MSAHSNGTLQWHFNELNIVFISQVLVNNRMSKAIVLTKILDIGTQESGMAWSHGMNLPDEELREHLWDILAHPTVTAAAAMGAVLGHQLEAKEGEPRLLQSTSLSLCLMHGIVCH